MANFWKLAFETLARMHGYPVPKLGLPEPERAREWSVPRCYELLALPAPPPQLLLPPPREISRGSFVRFKKSYIEKRGGHDGRHWAREYGNGVGIVRNIKVWGTSATTAQVDFPHRMECHYLHDLELDYKAERAMAMLKWGPMYGPKLRLASSPTSHT